ncbi:MAG: MFS transporter [Lentisphaerae bacterium]|jgi:MFS family permease|nr:MFS transporter [Lentisphaerota bacterium]MBT4817576.1 MFS transporter [Lentisphaerota bacterium]MBT5608521.1 MFS transporter [Lentisphaerota bacterium]MBT7058529.1 MFS transporter [Lentisphaerota bacterium]MBT7843238.1 MFS transporter [Lentisphaerota bacterium]
MPANTLPQNSGQLARFGKQRDRENTYLDTLPRHTTVATAAPQQPQERKSQRPALPPTVELIEYALSCECGGKTRLQTEPGRRHRVSETRLLAHTDTFEIRSELTPELRRRGRVFLALAVAGVNVALAVQIGLNANFMVNDIGVSAFQLGLMEAIRETCGITALLVLALLSGLPEPLVGAGMIAVFAVGLGGYAIVPGYGWALVASVVWSQGLHVWMPLPSSMAISLAEPGRAGHRLGQMRAAGSAGFTGGLVVALLLAKADISMRPMFGMALVVGCLGAVACFGIPRNIKTPGPRLVLRKKYWLFYLLSFLEGWRKQIFLCFAGFLLVKKYGTPLETMLLLWCIVQVIGCFSSPLIGRLIDRVGEKRILIFYFSALTLFFLGYALIPNPVVLYVLFVVDSAFFVFAMALTTFADRLVPPSERTPTLSMGVAMNHAAAVTMPLLGGIAWRALDHRWPFFIGAFAALVSVGVSFLVPSRKAPHAQPLPAE